MSSTRIIAAIVCIIVFSGLVALGNGKDLLSILGYVGFVIAIIVFLYLGNKPKNGR
jgi:hypothetical protein